jgi:hypothetical protein
MPKKKKPEPPPERGTGNPSDAYLASLYDRVHLRLPKGYLEKLETLAKEASEATGKKVSLPKWVAARIDEHWGRRK